MRVVIQRVKEASVRIDNQETRDINQGLCVFMGAGPGDDKSDIHWLVPKILNMRIFPDEQGKMNLSLDNIQGEILLISQFTLFASTKKGNRPSFNYAAEPDLAKDIYGYGVECFRQKLGDRLKTGEFAAHMDVKLENHGPVTIIIDTKDRE